ncbi:monocarboxylate transporter 14-like [Mytilus californianus]|uniref:monocarboxylate transporter 14-like n=1 Tax=Mytilus californianus TaxID=6549 RepID=UPI0022464C41|nr:monocarboxylate transporter 14-like [Mytilus californianus]
MRKGEVDGCWGWMIVTAAALNRIVIYGISYSAGVVYVVILEVFNEGSGITSWLSSLITAVLFFTCPLSGYLIERYDERKVAIAGSLIAAIGMTSSAFVSSVPALILTYGIISGIGCGIAFMPGSVAVAKYFKNHRPLAMAISSAGGGIGSFAFPPIIEMLNEYYTWRGMFLILGGITLNICVFGLVLRPMAKEVSPTKSHQQ